jgi:hypothetical protein
MSTYSLASAAIARRPDFAPQESVPRTRGELVEATKGATSADNDLTHLMKLLTAYSPTEVIALYIAGLGVARDLEERLQRERPAFDVLFMPLEWWNFFAFLVLSPIVVWLVFAGKLLASGKPLPIAFRTWPLWEMIAATVAYAAWTLALPDTPFDGFWWYSQATAGFAALFVSGALGAIAPFFQRTLPAG